MAVVLLLLVCGWISIINAQPNMVTILLPQGHQSVCRGESISYNCIGSGISMAVFSPPIVNESNSIVVPSSRTCSVIPNSAAAIILVDTTGSPLLMRTFTLYISDEQREGQRTVFCRVSAADGTITTKEANFSVLGAPSPATSLMFQKILASSSEDMTQVPVTVSWDAPENAQEFMLQIQNTDYDNTIRSLEKSVTVLLPYGTFSATLCTINRCGETCQDHSNSFSTGPQPTPASNDNSLLIATTDHDVKKALSTSSQIILTAVICSFVFFLFGILVGALCHRWARVFTKPCTGDIKHSNGTIHEHPSPTDTPADTAAPVMYEEITSDSTSRQKIELKENVAYGPI